MYPGKGISSGEGGWIFKFLAHNIATGDCTTIMQKQKHIRPLPEHPGGVGVYIDHGALIENLE
jgi:hypothetical protein